jgi:hypothetical protein
MEKQFEKLLDILKTRFENNKNRHENIKWIDVENKLINSKEKLKSLFEMEVTGGEPDVIGFDSNETCYTFFDCSLESPIGRRSLCYDSEALEGRKANKPKQSVIELTKKMKVELLDEEQYRYLQSLGNFDTKTSSWIKTPENVRKLGGALFCDRRYDSVFTYHNGASSYYSSRGFRASLKV